MELNILFFVLLLLVAFLYSSVGHGGASGYLALMALFSFSPDVMKPTALLLNIFVSAIAFFQFYRAKHFNWKMFAPLAITSIPAAFIGGLMVIEGSVYKQILGVLLLLPVLRFVFFSKINVENKKPFSVKGLLLLGGSIGLLSGMIGIGGGIILSPILLLLHWSDQKQTAAISALFIFVNSFAGLSGQIAKGISFSNEMYSFVGVAVMGGVMGAYLGAMRFDQKILMRILASVLLIASVKLLLV